MTITIHNIAAHLSLSVSTISRALNGYTDVAPSTRQRIFDAARELGYVPSDAARSLRRQRTNRLGLSVPSWIDYDSDYFSEIIRGVTVESARQSCNLMLYTSNAFGENGDLMRICRAREVDGIILIGAEHLEQQTSCLKHENMPFVVIGRPMDDPEISFVASDDKNGNFIATQHLIEQGHKRIAYIARFDQQLKSVLRVAGYKKALEEAGLPVLDELIVKAKMGVFSGCNSMSTLLNLQDPPTAVLAHNDSIAINALHVIRKNHLEVPDDIAIIGYNDTRSSLSTTPPLTSVHQPLFEMGQAAVECLLVRVSDKAQPPAQLNLAVKLIHRKSS